MKEKLFSFVITSYRNYKYIYEAIDSILIQTYQNIELIISNDGSTDFHAESVRAYIERKQRGNITNLVINNNRKNLGTVANVDYCRSIAKGEYIMYMAADDSLYDKNVIDAFVSEFERLGDDALCISSKVAMCGESLNNIKSIEPENTIIEIIKSYTPQQMFSRLSHTFTIPTTSTCYRRKLYEIVGPYDTKYFIIEDASLYLKMARNGIKFYWLDIIAAKHRDGGISHGNSLNLVEPYRKYRYDEILLFKNEILPYHHLLLDTDKKKMLEKWHYLDYAYWNDFEKKDLRNIKTWKFLARNGRFVFKNLLKSITFNDRPLMHLLALSNLLISILYLSNKSDVNTNIKSTLENICLIVISFVVILVLFIYIIRILYKIKKWRGL